MPLHPDARYAMSILGASDPAMDRNIGRRVRFINPSCTAERDLHTIECVQRIYDGTLAYRVVGDSEVHRFGRPARPSAVEFIS